MRCQIAIVKGAEAKIVAMCTFVWKLRFIFARQAHFELLLALYFVLISLFPVCHSTPPVSNGWP